MMGVTAVAVSARRPAAAGTVLIAGLLLLWLSSTVTWAAGTQYRHFQSRAHHFAIDYPSGWTHGGMSLGSAHYDFFLGPSTLGPRGPFRVNVNIAADRAGAKQTTDSYAVLAQRANARGGAVTDSRTPTTVDGHPAWELHGHLNGLLHNAFEAVVFVQAGQGWQITLSAYPRDMSRFSPILDHMVATFRTV
jgi:hypothetical protein